MHKSFKEALLHFSSYKEMAGVPVMECLYPKFKYRYKKRSSVKTDEGVLSFSFETSDYKPASQISADVLVLRYQTNQLTFTSIYKYDKKNEKFQIPQ